MATFRSILVATDFSDVSEQALDYALSLCETLGARLYIVHAYTLPAYIAPIEGSFVAPPEYVTALSHRLQQKLDEQHARAKKRVQEVEAKLVLGVSYTEIPRLADELGVDLIVVGTHGRTGLRHAVMGSVAERIVRLSSRPVLCIR